MQYEKVADFIKIFCNVYAAGRMVSILLSYKDQCNLYIDF